MWVLADKTHEPNTLYVLGSTDRSIRNRPPHNIHTTTYYTELYQPESKLACNSEGTDELAEDGTQLPKHVAAAK
jgi:hypothetical protein